jgi:hypothetical protein
MMGYYHGVLLHEEIHTVCDVWLAHTLAEMVSPPLDSKAHTTSRDVAHEVILHGIVDVMLPLIHDEFKKSVAAGAIPRAMVDEMEGIVAGVRAMGLRSAVTLAHIVALNYGIDFVLRGVYMNAGSSPGTCEFVRAVRAKLSVSAQKMLKISVPDMCSTAMVGKWMLRDYSFANGRVFAQHALVIVRQREGTLSVAMPGMVGAITAMNMRGVAVAVNLVRSTHVSTSIIGLNSVLMVRHLVTAENVAEAEARLKAAMVGVPWLYSVMGPSDGSDRVEHVDRVVFETLAASVYMHPPAGISAERESLINTDSGVYARRDDGDFSEADRVYNFNHVKIAEPRFSTREEEVYVIGMYGAGYFQPPMPDGMPNDVLVVANDFRMRDPRMTQRGEWIKWLQKTASRPQWRYEEMVRRIVAAGGSAMSLDAAKEISGFSVWSVAGVIQGFLGVFDTAEKVAHLKIGALAGGWIRVHLPSMMAFR